MTRWVGVLIASNVVMLLLEVFVGNVLIDQLALWPAGAGFRPWQLVSSAFLHANLSHLALNMYGLWMFGCDVEALLGPRRFVLLYMAAVLCASLTQLAVMAGASEVYPTLGASGGVFGVLLAFAHYFPKRTIVLLIPPVPMPAWAFAVLYAGIELTLGVTGSEAGVAHFAHLGGMLGAWLVIRRFGRRRNPDF